MGVEADIRARMAVIRAYSLGFRAGLLALAGGSGFRGGAVRGSTGGDGFGVGRPMSLKRLPQTGSSSASGECDGGGDGVGLALGMARILGRAPIIAPFGGQGLPPRNSDTVPVRPPNRAGSLCRGKVAPGRGSTWPLIPASRRFARSPPRLPTSPTRPADHAAAPGIWYDPTLPLPATSPRRACEARPMR